MQVIPGKEFEFKTFNPYPVYSTLEKLNTVSLT